MVAVPTRCAAVLALLVCGLSLAIEPTSVGGQSKRVMTPVDLINIPRVLDPQISSKGTIAFTVTSVDWPNNRRVAQMWRINADGSGLRRLTADSYPGPPTPRWSPDGSSIAFVSSGSLFVMSEDGRAARQVSKRTGISEIAWHPSGQHVYFLAFDAPSDAERERRRLRGDIRVLDEPRQRHLWRLAVADGAEARLTSGTDYIFAYKIAASGQRIIISRRPTNLPVDTNRMELWSIDATGGSAVQLTRNAIPEEDGELSPDGSQVLCLARANHRQEPYYNANVFLVPAHGGKPQTPLPTFSYEVLRAGWQSDSKSIWMIVNTGVRADLFQLDLASRAVTPLTKGDHALVPQSWNVAAGRHVFQIDEPARIGDIWTLTTGDTNATRVTAVYDYLDREFALPRQERIGWKGADGAAVEGVLTYPVDYQPGTRYPLVVQLHGGPEASDRFGWGSIFFNYQPALAARGYAILRPNYRGSSGYGNTFYREPIGGYFKHSHRDVLAGVDRLIAMGIADPDRLAVMGWSAGAHLVNKLITFSPRFKAAASGAGVANWISLYGSSDTQSDRDLWLGGSLWQPNAPIDTYWEHSPLKYVSAVRTPTLFLNGDEDPRIPRTQAIEMSRALRAHGVPTEVLLAPNEGHDWVRPSHQLYKINAEIEWFDKYVRERAYTPQSVPAENDAPRLP
jgi:dipeptidyl aminopeptidase/acylaminoacyl peptidase